MRLEGVVWWHVNSSFYNCAASQVNSSVNPHKCGLSDPVGGFLDSAHINKKNPLDASYTFYNRKMNYKCSNFTIAVFAYLCTCVFVYLCICILSTSLPSSSSPLSQRALVTFLRFPTLSISTSTQSTLGKLTQKMILKVFIETSFLSVCVTVE